MPMKFLKFPREDGGKESLPPGDPSSQQDELPGIGAKHAKIKPAPLPVLYVSTSLDACEPSQPDLLARDVTLSGVCFRRLDPEYYAWLRHKLTLAEKALEAGKIAYEAFDTLLTRFNDVYIWAMDSFGRDTLSAAMESVDRKNYVPPGVVTSMPLGGPGQAQLTPVPKFRRKG
jgi:hypothetical protein